MSVEPRSWPRLLVLALALGMGAWLRLRGLAEQPLHGDEYHTLYSADEGYLTILTTFDGVGSHVALPFLQRLSMDVFGAGVVPFRLVALVPGLLLLCLAYPLLRAFVRPDVAALSTLVLALNPMAVYYSRFARGYLLALLLALVLGWALSGVLARARRGRTTWSLLIASAALLPWVHLSTLGFVLALAAAGLGLALRESRTLALRLLAAFALAGSLAGLAYLPVLAAVRAYFGALVTEPPPLSWMGVPTLLAGGRLAAWAWLVLIPAGALLCWRRERAFVVLALAALLGPLALLLATKPPGMDYAWARYILSALPFLVALAAAAFLALTERLRLGTGPAFACASALLLLQHWSGPIGPRAAHDGAFSNTYLALHELREFDEPYPATPAFYRTLASDPAARRIVELPPLLTRSVLLYRSYALVHGKGVLVGWTGKMPRGIQGGPYVGPLEDLAGRADYLVLHRNQAVEVPGYYRFVYQEVWPRLREPADDTFMRRQATIHAGNFLSAEETAPISDRIRAERGPPYYEDEFLQVWKLAP